MSNTKISEDPALTAAQSASNDLVPVVDVSAGLNKSMTLAELATAVGAVIVTTSFTCGIGDADLTLNSTTTGTDKTALLQALLDRSLTQPLVVIWDGAYSVTGLTVDTSLFPVKIIALPGCGAITRAAANAPILRNANPTSGTATDTKGLTIEGGIWNGNNANQSHDNGAGETTDWGWVPGFFFCGVANVTMRDVRLYNARTFAAWFLNASNIVIDTIDINCGTTVGVNYDGIHFDGPADNIRISQVKAITRDDCVAFNADQPVFPGDFYTKFFDGGAITDVLVDGINMASSYYCGVRILSRGARVDRIRINDVQGTTSAQAAIIDFFTDGGTGTGNFGHIVLSGFNVNVTNANHYHDCMIYVNGVIERLELRGLHRHNWTNTFPTVVIDAQSVINSCLIEFSSHENSSSTAALNQIQINGNVKELVVKDGVCFRTAGAGAATGPMIYFTAGSSLSNRLVIDGAKFISTDGLLKIAAGITLPEVFFTNCTATHLRELAGSITSVKGDGFNYGRGLRYYARGNEVAGLNLFDAVGSRTLTQTGTPGAAAGGGRSFVKASNQYFTLAGASAPVFSPAASPFTFACKFKPRIPGGGYGGGAAAFPFLCGKLVAAGAAEWYLFWDSAGSILNAAVFPNSGAGTAGQVTLAQSNITAGGTYYVALTIDGALVTLYVNNAAPATAAFTTTVYQNDTLNFALGAVPGGTQNLEGDIADVAVYGRAWTFSEFAQFYNGGSGYALQT